MYISPEGVCAKDDILRDVSAIIICSVTREPSCLSAHIFTE